MPKTSKTISAKPRYVLVVEDNVHHAELITEILDRHFAPVIIHTVDTIEDGIDFAVQSSYDLIITGAVIRNVPIAETLPKLKQLSLDTPIIVISGRGNERLAAELIKKGASEYLVKTRETLETLASLLEKYLVGRPRSKRKKTPQKDALGTASPKALMREVDRITQKALSLAGSKRSRGKGPNLEINELDDLLGQIKRLKDLASKLQPK